MSFGHQKGCKYNDQLELEQGHNLTRLYPQPATIFLVHDWDHRLTSASWRLCVEDIHIPEESYKWCLGFHHRRHPEGRQFLKSIWKRPQPRLAACCVAHLNPDLEAAGLSVCCESPCLAWKALSTHRALHLRDLPSLSFFTIRTHLPLTKFRTRIFRRSAISNTSLSNHDWHSDFLASRNCLANSRFSCWVASFLFLPTSNDDLSNDWQGVMSALSSGIILSQKSVTSDSPCAKFMWPRYVQRLLR